MTRLDRTALRQGASVALVFAVPFAVLSRWFADSGDSSGFAALFWLAALGGFTLGAGVAAWVQRVGTPFTHGTITAGGTYIAAQAVFIVVKLARGGDVNWLGAFFTLTVVLVVGVIGGALGAALHRRGFSPSSSRR